MSARYKHGMNWIRQEKRLALYMRDNFSCLYCGKGIEEAEMVLTLDHVQHRGGNDASNLVTACLDCNMSKGWRSLERFLREVEKPERVRARIARHCAADWKKILPEAKRIIAARKKGEPF